MVIIVALCFLLSMPRRETSFANNPRAARQILLLFDKEQQSPTELLGLVENLSDNDQEVREGSRRRIVALGIDGNLKGQLSSWPLKVGRSIQPL
jgi:hypothetical protein